MPSRTPPKAARVKTVAEVQEWFERTGMTVSEWARRRHVNPDTVYALLYGRTQGRRGESHRVAVMLGLKRGVAASAVGRRA